MNLKAIDDILKRMITERFDVAVADTKPWAKMENFRYSHLRYLMFYDTAVARVYNSEVPLTDGSPGDGVQLLVPLHQPLKWQKYSDDELVNRLSELVDACLKNFRKFIVDRDDTPEGYAVRSAEHLARLERWYAEEKEA